MPFSDNPFEQVQPFLTGTEFDPTYREYPDNMYLPGAFTTEEDAEAFWGMTGAERYWQDYGQFYKAYDWALEGELLEKKERDMEAIISDAYQTNHQLESGLASLGFRSGLGSKSKQLYYDSVSANLNNQRLESLSDINSLRRDYTKSVLDTHTTLLDMGVFAAPETALYDEYGNEEYDCQAGQSWWTGEGSFSESACEWMNNLYQDVSDPDWWFGENSIIDDWVFDPIEDAWNTYVVDNPYMPWNWSDERLKKDIKLIGQSPSGVNIYEFRFKDNDTTISAGYDSGKYQGVLSQEVPWASVEDPETGFFKTDYSKIDVDFKEVD